MDLSVVPFASDDEDDNVREPPVIGRPTSRSRVQNHAEKGFKTSASGVSTEPSAEPVVVNPNSPKIRYAECMRNHAATVGGHANDGCGEYMETPHSPLTCAACGCHRNFHRREVSFSGIFPFHHHQQHRPQKLLLTSSSAAVAAPPPVHYNVGPLSAKLPAHHPPPHLHHHSLPPPSSHHHDEMGGGDETPERIMVGDGHDDMVGTHTQMGRSAAPMMRSTPTTGASGGSGATGGSSGKRFRTKFTQEQKERMLEFAEKLGWRIQRHDDAALNQFCEEIGVKRHVLKVWMHNNKNAHQRRINLSGSPAEVASGSVGSGMAMPSTSSSLPSSVPPPQSVGV